MIRTQIELTPSQYDRLKRLAALNGVSMAAEIRVALDRHLERHAAEDSGRRRALASIGGFRSGRTDVSVRHDEQMDEAFGD